MENMVNVYFFGKKYTVPAASVDFGRFVHITGNAANELHDEEDIEPAGKEGGDTFKTGAAPAVTASAAPAPQSTESKATTN